MPTIKLYSTLRNVAGTKELSVAGTSAGEIVSELVKRHPALAANLLGNGQIRPHVIITINGHPAKDMDAPVAEQDQIAIFPSIAGG
jgi:molybdopterin synthase sulfur carrier subunit